MEQLLACNSNWLEGNQQRRISGNTLSNTSSGYVPTTTSGGITIGTYWYPYYQTWYPSSYTPVNLKMSEVEYLRKQAKTDKKLREILQKFTHLIQITVDFE
jgi:hypothetical protein